MKKLLLALLLALATAVPAAAQTGGGQPVICNKIFTVNQGAVALTKVISGVAGDSISICGWTLSGGAAASSAALSYGTGTNCGTGTTTLLPIHNLPINGGLVDHVDFAQTPVPAVNASGVPIDVCLVTTGTGPITVVLYYAQF